MRILAGLLAFGMAAAAFAGDGMLGTKQGASTVAAPPTSGGLGLMSFIQMIAALAIVLLLLKFVLPKVAGIMNKKLVTPLGSVIRIQESAAFAGGTLYVVQAKSKTLLLSVATSGVTCLADITDGPKTEPEVKTFQEMVEEEIETPTFAVVQTPAEPADEQISIALERLSRFAS